MEEKTGEKAIGKPEKRQFTCGNFRITPFYLPHTKQDKETKTLVPCPNYGYYIVHDEMGSFLYMTDYEYPTMSFRNARVNHILSEVNYCEELVDKNEANYDHRLRGHLSLSAFKKDVLVWNMSPNLRTVTMCHLSDYSSNEQLILRESRKCTGKNVNIQIAKAGMTIELKKFPF